MALVSCDTVAMFKDFPWFMVTTPGTGAGMTLLTPAVPSQTQPSWKHSDQEFLGTQRAGLFF